MDYKLIVIKGPYDATSVMLFEQEVKDYIKKGWKPLGGVSVSMSGNSMFEQGSMAQAMIKEE